MALLAALALIVGIGYVSASEASAVGRTWASPVNAHWYDAPARPMASNGYHTSYLSCESGGTTVKVALQYLVNGVGSATVNSAELNSVVIDTNPNAALDRVSVYGLNDTSGEDKLMFAKGGTVASQNDVYDGSYYFNVNPTYYWANGVEERFKVFVWGGVGNSADSCTVSARLL